MTALDITEQIDRKYEEDLQILKNFCLMDDDFLTKCFDGDTDCIELVLRIVLEKQDLKVLDSRTQVFIENLLKRSVRFDVLATDDMGLKYNIEIQHNDEGADSRRARYHSSMMDANLLKKRGKFENLPESYVIFITENDVLGEGYPTYRIERCILENGKKFNDGAHIVYVNGTYRDESPLGKLMHDFFCTNPDDMNYKVLAERVRFFKETKEGVMTMCKAMEDRINASFNEGIKEMASRMLEDGKYPLEEVARLSRLSLEEVKKIRDGRTA